MAGTLMGVTQNEKAMLFRSLQRIRAEATSHGFGITKVLGPSRQLHLEKCTAC